MPLNGHIKLELVVLRITPGLHPVFPIHTLQTITKTYYPCKKQMFVKLKFRISRVNLPSGLYGTRYSSYWNRMSVRKLTGYNTVTNLTKCVRLWRGSNLAKSTCPTVNQARRWYCIVWHHSALPVLVNRVMLGFAFGVPAGSKTSPIASLRLFVM